MLITRAFVRDSPEGLKPRNRGFPGPAHLLRQGGISGRANGMWVSPCGNVADTFGEEKAPKGEAQERCRCEIKPARARREETAKRVIKPWRRTVAGRQSPGEVDLRSLNVLKGKKAHERSRHAAARRLGRASAKLWRKVEPEERIRQVA